MLQSSRAVFNILSAAGMMTLALATADLAGADPALEPIKPLPQSLHADVSKARLGRLLFKDVRLSANNRVSCASCHDVSNGGADGRVRSIGFNGQLTTVNAPSVLNAAFNFKQFWNGRADSLESQVEMVVRNPIEMGAIWSDVAAKIAQDPAYQKAFAASYPTGITPQNICSAIAAYERTLITPNSRFDRYLRGDQGAISDAERVGYAKFKQYGCVACHQGINVGGNMFQKFGVMGDYFENRGGATDADLGRYLVTKDDGDKHVFKVPSLRNVALTAPYFHDGTATTLDAAVDVMFRFQLGRVASKEDKASIISFLNTLTADVAPAASL